MTCPVLADTMRHLDALEAGDTEVNALLDYAHDHFAELLPEALTKAVDQLDETITSTCRVAMFQGEPEAVKALVGFLLVQLLTVAEPGHLKAKQAAQDAEEARADFDQEVSDFEHEWSRQERAA